MKNQKKQGMKAGILFLSALCLAGRAAMGALTTIGFDDLPTLPASTPGLVENDRYLSQGVVLTNSGRADTRPLYVSNAAITTSGNNYIYAGDGLFPGAVLTLSFYLPGTNTKAVADFVSLDVCDYPEQSSGLWTMQILDANGNVLDTVQDTNSFQRTVQFQRTQADIFQIEFTSSSDYDVVDTLSYGVLTPALVPEPSTWAMLGLGTVLLAARRRRSAQA